MYRFLIIFIVLILSCSSKNANLYKVLSYQIHQKTFHPYAKGIKPIERIGLIPKAILDSFKNWDKDCSYLQFMPDSQQIGIVSECISQLPPLNRKAIDERLVGIYFIKNFRSSGVTDFVRDSSGLLYFYFIFDSRLFNETVHQRATYRENTCFIQKKGLESIRIEGGEDISAFRYSMLHESTHAVDLVYQITPFLTPFFSTIRIFSDSPSAFAGSVWNSYNEPKPEYNYYCRDSLTFYGFQDGPKIKVGNATNVYFYFQESPFPSVYGSMNWAEDLAEMVYYHLTQILGTEYKISLILNGESYFDYEPLKSEKVKARFTTISNFYNLNPVPPPVVGVGLKKRRWYRNIIAK